MVEARLMTVTFDHQNTLIVQATVEFYIASIEMFHVLISLVVTRNLWLILFLK
jgi:hypothetical protein